MLLKNMAIIFCKPIDIYNTPFPLSPETNYLTTYPIQQYNAETNIIDVVQKLKIFFKIVTFGNNMLKSGTIYINNIVSNSSHIYD